MRADHDLVSSSFTTVEFALDPQEDVRNKLQKSARIRTNPRRKDLPQPANRHPAPLLALSCISLQLHETELAIYRGSLNALDSTGFCVFSPKAHWTKHHLQFPKDFETNRRKSEFRTPKP
jgi:hypothetical protein